MMFWEANLVQKQILLVVETHVSKFEDNSPLIYHANKHMWEDRQRKSGYFQLKIIQNCTV